MTVKTRTRRDRLTWRRQPEQEAKVLALYERNGQLASAAPAIYYGYDDGGSEVLHALVSREPFAEGDDRWHISISAEDRVPTWDEMTAALHGLRPGVPFVLGVPPRSWWINVHPYVLHAWESKDWPLVNRWRAERRGDTPT